MAAPPPPPGKPGVPPPPVAVVAAPAVPTGGPPAFTFAREDVLAAAEDLMAHLPPPSAVEVVDEPPRAICIVGPKGGKTVASIAIKTNKAPGLPRPKGSIVVVLQLDNQAQSSFENFCYDRGITFEPSEQPYFIPILRPKGRYKARVSQSDPACAAYVRDVVFEVEKRLGARGDVGLFVHDNYGDWANKMGNYIAAYANGFSNPLKLEGTQWTPRREFYTDSISHALGAVCMGGWAILNVQEGGLENELEKDPTKLKKRLAKEGIKERIPPAKALIYRENNENLSAIFTLAMGMDLVKEQARYMAEVWEGRVAKLGFRTGAECDITDGNISSFLLTEQAKAENHVRVAA